MTGVTRNLFRTQRAVDHRGHFFMTRGYFIPSAGFPFLLDARPRKFFGVAVITALGTQRPSPTRHFGLQSPLGIPLDTISGERLSRRVSLGVPRMFWCRPGFGLGVIPCPHTRKLPKASIIATGRIQKIAAAPRGGVAMQARFFLVPGIFRFGLGRGRKDSQRQCHKGRQQAFANFRLGRVPVVNHIKSHQNSGLHLLSGLLLGLTAPAFWPLALVLASLFAGGSAWQPIRPFLVVGATLGWSRQTFTKAEKSLPLSWDRHVRQKSEAFRGLRQKIRVRLQALPDSERPLVQAMVWGEPLNRSRARTYQRAGISHLTSQSGLHIGVVVTTALWLGGSLPAAPFFAFLTGCLFACFVGGKPAVWRALLMASSTGAAKLLNRPASGYGSLAFAAVLLFIWDPDLVHDPGVHLSFGATLGILHLGPLFQSLLGFHSERFQNWRAMRVGIAAFSMSLGAFLGTCPASLQRGSSLPLFSPLTNLIAVPLGSLYFLLSLGASALALLFPSALDWYGACLVPLSFCLDFTAQAAADFFPLLRAETLFPPSLLSDFSLGAFSILLFHGGACTKRPWERQNPLAKARGPQEGLQSRRND